MLTVQFAGSGDAFGTGGRFQTCISLHDAQTHLLVDCGASSLIALKRLGLEPTSVDFILITHLHGDHFGGIPFLVLDAQFSRREKPLLLAGPPGIEARVFQAMEVFFPGSSQVARCFELRFLEIPEKVATQLSPDLYVTAYAVVHPSGNPSYALRIKWGEKVVSYSGDGEWTDNLLEAARQCDLFICEAYSFDKPVKYHLSYSTLVQHREHLECQRLILTHLGPQMLERRSQVKESIAEDGLVVSL